MRIMNTLLASALAALVSTSAFAQLQQTPPAAPVPAAPAAPAVKPATPPAAAPAPAAKPVTAAPAPAAKPSAAAPVAAPTLVNLNAATPEQLDTIPNIGEKRSEAIIKGRPYKTTQELVTKKVLTQGIFDKIKDKITVRVNLNTASAEELDSLPGIGEKRSDAIIKGRPYKSVADLTTKKVLTPGVVDKIKTFVDVK